MRIPLWIPQRRVDTIQCSTIMTNKMLNRSQASYQLFSFHDHTQAKARQLLGFREQIHKTLHKFLKNID